MCVKQQVIPQQDILQSSFTYVFGSGPVYAFL